MDFDISDLHVCFPYKTIYPEQYQYMNALYKGIRNKGSCFLEMASGTGKTVAILSVVLATIKKNNEQEMGLSSNPNASSKRKRDEPLEKMVYCSRTIPEIQQVLEEAKRVLNCLYCETTCCKEKESNDIEDIEMDSKQDSSKKKLKQPLVVGLGARRHLCINTEISSSSNDNKRLDSNCHDITSAAGIEAGIACKYYMNYLELRSHFDLQGSYSFQDLRALGEQYEVCPYHLSRYLSSLQNVSVVCSYEYVISPSVSQHFDQQFSTQNAVVIFDEAHNIDSVCLESISTSITEEQAAIAFNSISGLDSRREVTEKVSQFNDNQSTDNSAQANKKFPGTLRNPLHFLSALKRFILFIQNFVKGDKSFIHPLDFLSQLEEESRLTPRTIRHLSTRLETFLDSLKVNVSKYNALYSLCEFGQTLGTFGLNEGTAIIVQKRNRRRNSSNSSLDTIKVLHFACLDPSIAMQIVTEKYRNVVVTSGTLSPMSMYCKLLGIEPVVSERFTMTLSRPNICPMIVSRGIDNSALTIMATKDKRSNIDLISNIGDFIKSLSGVVPDGMIVFFPSYKYLEECIFEWGRTSLLQQISENKIIFLESRSSAETSFALENYKKACDSGLGSILFCVCRGKLSEGVDFTGHYGRTAVVIGVPFTDSSSAVSKARLAYIYQRCHIREHEYLTFDAIRAVAQAVGRVIRGKLDYATMVFVDKRFRTKGKLDKLPMWVLSSLPTAHHNHSTSTATITAREFYRAVSQPFDENEMLGHSLWTLDDIRERTSRKEELIK